MKALNGRFGMLHGISSLANLAAVLALGMSMSYFKPQSIEKGQDSMGFGLATLG
jgi:hypothetical protein